MTAAIGNRKQFAPLPGGGYVFTLLDDGVSLEVRHLRRNAYQELRGELDVIVDWAGAPTFEGSLSCADLNLSNQRDRIGRAEYCAKRARTKPDEFDWPAIIDEACLRVIRAERTSTPAIVLDDAPATAPPRDFLVHGLPIPADSHSQIVSDGGGLKSLLLLLVLGEMAKGGLRVGLLDWEWSAERHLGRKRRLFGDDRLDTLFYLRCRNSITVERDHIRRFCEERKIDFLGIDSISACCDGKLSDDDVARAYNRALDGLPPSLAAAHVAKNTNGNGETKTDLKAFGSAFFHNYARCTWTLTKQVGASDDLVTVLLTPFKQNDGPRSRPVAIEFTFGDVIGVRGVDPATVDSFAKTLPVHVRVSHLLRGGPLTIAAIADELEAKVDTIEKSLKRGAGKVFTKLPGSDGIARWALLETRVA